MDELERLIKQQWRAAPSRSLDERIAAVTKASPTPAGAATLRRKGRLALCSIAACAGLVGFVFGRTSVSTGNPKAEKHQVLSQSESLTHSVLKVPFASEQVADFAIRLPPTEGIFGAIPRDEQ